MINEQRLFKTNPQKSANKVTINSFMMGSLFFVLTLITTLGKNEFSSLIMFQLVLAIPLLYVASLAYSKVGYWKETYYWDVLGWFTNTTGNLFVMNAIGAVAATFDPVLARAYFSLFILLMFIYTAINIAGHPAAWAQKLFKLLYLLVVIFVGGVFAI
jgi:hypothetical protein